MADKQHAGNRLMNCEMMPSQAPQNKSLVRLWVVHQSFKDSAKDKTSCYVTLRGACVERRRVYLSA